MAFITPRSEWGARKGPGSAISVPTAEVYIHHTVTLVTGGTNATVTAEKAHMRFLEDVRGFSIGVPYSFLVFPSGRVYEGQGWGREGAHTCNGPPITRCWNKTAHGLCFVGNYETARLPDKARSSMRALIEEGISKGKLTAGVVVKPHRSVKPTACPGQHTLPHLDYFQNGDDEMTPEQEKMLKEVHNFVTGARKPFGASTPFGSLGQRIGKAAKATENNPPHSHAGEPPPNDPDYAPRDHDHDLEGKAR